MPNKYAYIDGLPVFVHHTGPTTLPEQPPVLEDGETVLCLHGEGGNGHLFRPLLDALAGAHSPIAFDQPGHGRSGSLDSLASIERMAAFSLGLCDKLGIGSAVLLGHSMGAAVALRMALERPGSVRALVLCSAGSRIPLTDAQLEQARRISEGKERRQFDATIYSPNATPDVMRRGFMEGIKTDPRAVYGDLLACADWDDTGRLGEIGVPTLAIHGEDEIDAVKQAIDALVSGVAGAQRQSVPEAGHSLPLEAPEALADAVTTFLASLPAEGAA